MEFPGKPKNSADINVKRVEPGTKLPKIEQTRSLSVIPSLLRTISRKKLNKEAQQEPEVLRFTYFRCPMCKNPYWQKSEVELHIIGTHKMTIDRFKTMLTCGEIKIIEETFQ